MPHLKLMVAAETLRWPPLLTSCGSRATSIPIAYYQPACSTWEPVSCIIQSRDLAGACFSRVFVYVRAVLLTVQIAWMHAPAFYVDVQVRGLLRSRQFSASFVSPCWAHAKHTTGARSTLNCFATIAASVSAAADRIPLGAHRPYQLGDFSAGDSMAGDQRVPVTMLSGFLGAGVPPRHRPHCICI